MGGPVPVADDVTGGVDLYWLPLGAGGRCVAVNGRLFEAAVALRQHRPAADLYHAALEVRLGGDRYVVEMAPVWNLREPDRGVVREGPVGARPLGRWRAFRYEVRAWRGGRIPDVAFAVDSPRRLSSMAAQAQELLRVLPSVPEATWGRDEQRAGEMWNSNSLVAWALLRSGHDLSGVRPPAGGRAPGWQAGLVVAERVDGTVGEAATTPTPAQGLPAIEDHPPGRRRLSGLGHLHRVSRTPW